MNNTDFNPSEFFRDLKSNDFLNLGMEEVAYIRPTRIENQTAYVICAADGTTLSIVDSYENALGAIYSNDMSATTLQ